MELVLKNETYAVIGAAMEVHNELGPGFLEAVYQEALEVELAERGIPFQRQKPLRIRYKDRLLAKEYVADVVCYDSMIVELKALDTLSLREEAQVINMLKATGYPAGLLINFGSIGKLQWKKFVGPGAQ